MKLLKALVRTHKLEEIVAALEAAKAPGINVSRAHGVGYGYAVHATRHSRSLAERERWVRTC